MEDQYPQLHALAPNDRRSGLRDQDESHPSYTSYTSYTRPLETEIKQPT